MARSWSVRRLPSRLAKWSAPSTAGRFFIRRGTPQRTTNCLEVGGIVKKAIVTGITGQDGSYLAELLLSKGYDVHGIVRRVAIEDPTHRFWRIRHLLKTISLHAGSLESYASLFGIVDRVQPDECYHLAAQSFVSQSFEDAFSAISIDTTGTHFLLDALRLRAPECRFYFAGTSEMFGNAKETPQNEQ